MGEGGGGEAVADRDSEGDIRERGRREEGEPSISSTDLGLHLRL